MSAALPYRCWLNFAAFFCFVFQLAVRNPLVIASVGGSLLSFAHVPIPAPVLQPLQLIGAAAVPLMLMGFGLSLSGARVLVPADQQEATPGQFHDALPLIPLPQVPIRSGGDRP